MAVAFILYLIINYEYHQDKVETYISSMIMWMISCFGITEMLSVFNAITSFNLRLVWGGIDVCLLVFILIKKIDVKVLCRSILKYKSDKIVYVFGLYSAMMLALAIKMVPYNWDSMVYHCARIFHWMQNKSVAHYATSIDRQVGSPVLGDFVNLNVYAMNNGNDHFLNLMQCISYLTNGVLVYHIAKKLKCGKSGCVIAALLFFTTPIAFAEALTTQVDNFSALWLLAFVYVILDFLDATIKLTYNREQMTKVFELGFCIAWGYLSKPSVGFGMLFFAIWLLIVVINRRDSIAVVLKMIVSVVPIIAVSLFPEMIRNLKTFHAISPSNVGARQLIGTYNIRYVIVNFFKNFTYNLPNIYIPNFNSYIYKFVNYISQIFEVDINNPTISEDGGEFLVHSPQTYSCDTAVNPIILWLLVVSLALMIIIWRNLKHKDVRTGYYVVSVFAFCIFCAVLRWERFVSRYMISYLALVCPSIVIAIEEFSKCKEKDIRPIIYSIVAFLCTVEFLGLMNNRMEQAFEYSRVSGYFVDRSDKEYSYYEMAEYINSVDVEKVGLYIGVDSYEFPLVQMIDNKVEIEHINVDNDTAIYMDDNFIPDLIFTSDKGISDYLEYKGIVYNLVKSNNDEAIYVSENN